MGEKGGVGKADVGKCICRRRVWMAPGPVGSLGVFEFFLSRHPYNTSSHKHDLFHTCNHEPMMSCSVGGF